MLSTKPRSRARLDRECGVNLWGNDKSPFEKRKYPIGQHGKNLRRRASAYGDRLLKKKRIRSYYNLNEKQFKTAVLKSYKNTKLAPTDAIFTRLEMRLDQVVYKLAFAPSIFAARQLVTHGHFLLNNKKVNIPSIILKAGDVVSVAEKSRGYAIINAASNKPSLSFPAYLKRIDNFSGTVLRSVESMQEIPFSFEPDPSAVVATYRG